MSSLNTLLSACQTEQTILLAATRDRVRMWEEWLQPLTGSSPVGEDPCYDDDFQQMREEVNKLSGANTELICQLAEKLLMASTKDIRVATYYCWAKLHSEGERGLAEGLELLAGLMERFGSQLYPQRDRSRKAALEWLAGSRITDTLFLCPEVVKEYVVRATGALQLIAQLTENEPAETRAELNALYGVLETRIQKTGDVNAVLLENNRSCDTPAMVGLCEAPVIPRITSDQDLLVQGRIFSEYLREQPQGWLSAHHLIKSLRHDTLRTVPASDVRGRTRIEPPKAEQRAWLNRLYLQQDWAEMLAAADSAFSRGANHLWLDLQWYIHQALMKSGQETLADIVIYDLKCLLVRLSGLEILTFSDGTPFADQMTLNWIKQEVLNTSVGWETEIPRIQMTASKDDILALEPEAVALADSEGLDTALIWLQTQPDTNTKRQQWLLRLLMGRIAERYGKHELARHLFVELGERADEMTLTDWEPDLLFEVRARHLKLLRMKAENSEADRGRLTPVIDHLLAGLIAVDPAGAAMLCE